VDKPDRFLQYIVLKASLEREMPFHWELVCAKSEQFDDDNWTIYFAV
jgi:hypothetical protein